MLALISHSVAVPVSDQPKTAELLVIFVAIKFVGVGQFGLLQDWESKVIVETEKHPDWIFWTE